VPFKTFVSGEILSATDVNTQVMQQQVCVFADATARGASISSPVEGQFAFLKDSNKLFFYNVTACEEF
jgi:hypothetical protein